MDHSVGGYLSRRTTEELKVILKSCLKEGNGEDIVLEILEERTKNTEKERLCP